MNQQRTEQYLVALQFLSQVLQSSPDEAFLQQLVRDDMLSHLPTWEAFRTPDAPAPQPYYAGMHPEDAARELARMYSLSELEARYEERANDKTTLWRRFYLQLHLDHMALFSGPTPLAPPWESVWRERDKLLFGERTEEVMAAYARWGITIEHHGHEPEDHLGLELAFSAFLLQTMLQHSGTTSTDGATPEESLRSFLDEHIIPWAGQCLAAVQAQAETTFYRELSVLARALIVNLRTDLDKA